jgi:threonine dehydrogenase-like Zn-dependent dehydrogenase
MKAAIYQGEGRMAVEDIPIPDPLPQEILIKVKYSAICGTDVHAFLYDIAPPGSVLGHEFSGVISAIGKDVKDWVIGDRVIGGGGSPPPGFEQPLRKQEQYNYRLEGFTNTRKRGYAEYTVLNHWEPLEIPGNVTDLEACLTEPCSVAVRAVRLSNQRLGDTVVVLGAGPIGLLCLQAAKAAGAGKIIVSEPSETRRMVASELGADAVINPLREDVYASVMSLTESVGPDVVYECAAAQPTLDDALNMVRKKGNVMLVALAWENIPLLPVDWAGKEVELKTTFGGEHQDWQIALNLISSGKINLNPLTSETYFVDIEEIQETFRALASPSDQVQMIVKF